MRDAFRKKEDELRSLPGIGPYTAGAIAAIAFGGRHAAVDGNVEPCDQPDLCNRDALPDSKPEIRQRTQALVPAKRPGDFAQAMMDLGATICTPRDPNCLICPWSEDCQGRITGLAPSLPRKRAKKKIPVRRGTAFWIERADGAVLLRRRPEKGCSAHDGGALDAMGRFARPA